MLIVLHLKVGLPALENGGKFSSNGSLLSQNGIKYCSEPELAKKREQGGGDSRESEVPESEGYVNIIEGQAGGMLKYQYFNISCLFVNDTIRGDLTPSIEQYWSCP